MRDAGDTNADIWKSDEVVKEWVAQSSERDRQRIAHWQLLGALLPFEQRDSFTFLDLGAGTGAATRALLDLYPNSQAILAEYSPQMIEEGERALAAYGGRFHYEEFDMLVGKWPSGIPSGLDAAVTSLCIHHLPDDRKQGLFAEIFERLAPRGWYLNYDPVTSDDPIVAATWQHTNDRDDPHAQERREHRSELEHARWENHVRYMIPLDRQLGYFRAAGFEGVDVYWKHLESVIYGGRRPK